jgi:hypothetical protein
VAGLVAVFASAQSSGQSAPDLTTGGEGPFSEVIYVDTGPLDWFKCIASDPGYVDLGDGTNDEAILAEEVSAPTIIVEPPGIRIFRLNGELPELLFHENFDEENLNLNGHASITAGPFIAPPPPPEQIVAVTADGLDSTDGAFALLELESTFNPDVHIDCTLFTEEDEMDPGIGMTIKKTAVKKKIAKANKRKVNKKKARKKAAVKRKKAIKKALR